MQDDPGHLRLFAGVQNLLVTIEEGGPGIVETGFIQTVAGNGRHGFSNDGGSAVETKLDYPHAIWVDGEGNLLVADTNNHRIRKVDVSGTISTVVGDGYRSKEHGRFSGDWGPAALVSLNRPHGMCLDGAGNLYVADRDNHRVRKVDLAGNISTVAGNGRRGFTGDGVVAIFGSLNRPYGVCVDGAGNLYIADKDNNRVRKVDSNGIITTLAGTGNREYSGDGVPATLASLNRPRDVFADHLGNVYVADTDNHRVRKIAPDGIITTVAGNGESRFYGDGRPAIRSGLTPASIFVDALGNLYIGDKGFHRILKVDGAGILTTVAGNGEEQSGGNGDPATEAALDHPAGVFLDPAGRLFFSDAGAHRIRMVTPSPVSGPVDGVPRLVTAIDNLVFGAVEATGIARLKLPIRNEGTKTLHVFNVVSSDLQVAVTPKSVSIKPGHERVLTVRFRSRPGRARTGEIILNSDDPNRGSLVEQ